jgi:outer membrane receptor protein involved in Fe transport
LLYARWYSLSGFVQDDFRVSPRLTLNLGLRYDYNSPQVDKFDVSPASTAAQAAL